MPPDRIRCPAYDEIHSLYQGRTDYVATRPDPKMYDTEQIEIKNKTVLREQLETWGTTLAQNYSEVTEDAPGGLGGRMGRPGCAKWVPLEYKVLDPDIPLTAFAAKTFFTHENGEKKEELHFFLWKKIPKASDPTALMEEFRSRDFYDEEVACIRVEVGSDHFEETEPEPYAVRRYRELGTELLKGAEAFAQVRANQMGKNIQFIIPGRQLDTVSWALEQGYAAKNPSEAEKLDKVLTGDPSLALGEDDYFFPAETPPESRGADHYSKLQREGGAFAVSLEKTIETQELTDIRKGLHDEFMLQIPDKI